MWRQSAAVRRRPQPLLEQQIPCADREDVRPRQLAQPPDKQHEHGARRKHIAQVKRNTNYRIQPVAGTQLLPVHTHQRQGWQSCLQINLITDEAAE